MIRNRTHFLANTLMALRWLWDKLLRRKGIFTAIVVISDTDRPIARQTAHDLVRAGCARKDQVEHSVLHN